MKRLSIGLAVAAALALMPGCDGDDSADNERPVTVSDTGAMNEDEVYDLDVLGNDSDPDGDVLHLVSAQADWGTAAVNGDRVRVSPPANYTGTVKVTYTVSDSHATMPGHAVVTVRPVDDAPTTSPISLSDVLPAGVDLLLPGSDPDDATLVYTIVTPPAHGTLTGTPPRLHYTPTAGYTGADSFRYRVSDGTMSAEADASLRMDPTNILQVAPRDSTITTSEDAAITFGFEYDDPDNAVSRYTVELVTLPQHGGYSGLGDLKGRYTPNRDSNGTDSLSFRFRRKSDGALTRTGVITFNVTALDDLPVAEAKTLSLDEDGSAGVTLVGSDVDSAAVTFRIKTPPTHGTVDLQGAVASYHPDANFAGSDTFAYVAVADGKDSSPATVAVTVRPINDPPVAQGSTAPALEDTATAVAFSASDVDTAALTYSLVAGPAHGTFALVAGGGTYTAQANYFGPDELTFQVSDGFAQATAKVAITVASVNDLPTAREELAQIEPGATLDFAVLANDTDVEPGALQISALPPPAHGTVSKNTDGSIHYVSEPGFKGTVEIAYTAKDVDGGEAVSVLRVGLGEFPDNVPIEAIPGFGVANPPSSPTLSRDGRFVAFETVAALLAADTNTVADIYVLDRITKNVELISAPVAGQVSDGASTRAVIAADGASVLFTSSSRRLVDGDDNGHADVFLRERARGITRRVSVGVGDEQANGPSTGAGISADGKRVVFTSDAFNLVDRDVNGSSDVFVRDLSTSKTIRISTTASAGEADGPSFQPVISADGNVVAFASAATNLVPGDSNAVFDVFVRDLVAGSLTRVSVRSGADGEQGNGASTAPSLSADGAFVSFLSTATNLGGSTNASNKAYVRDRLQLTTLLGISQIGLAAAYLSADGRYLLVSASGAGYLRDRFGNVTKTIFTGAWDVSSAAISADGRYLLFATRNTSSNPFNAYALPSPF